MLTCALHNEQQQWQHDCQLIELEVQSIDDHDVYPTLRG